jgi:hypothetical protein
MMLPPRRVTYDEKRRARVRKIEGFTTRDAMFCALFPWSRLIDGRLKAEEATQTRRNAKIKGHPIADALLN